MSAIDETERAARAARIAEIEACGRCDPCGWRLGADGRPADIARRCDHRDPPAGRDVTEPVHQRPSS